MVEDVSIYFRKRHSGSTFQNKGSWAAFRNDALFLFEASFTEFLAMQRSLLGDEFLVRAHKFLNVAGLMRLSTRRRRLEGPIVPHGWKRSSTFSAMCMQLTSGLCLHTPPENCNTKAQADMLEISIDKFIH